MFFRVIQHLLPTGRAWRTLTDKALRWFFEGLAAGAPTSAREFIDDVHGDLHPETTRELEKWLRQFGLTSSGDEATDRAQLTAAWQALGGQSPAYLQATVRSAGFDVYLHPWWESVDPRVPLDPREHTTVPVVGTCQCGEEWAECGEFDAQCDDFLVNDPGYLVNKNLTRRAPPIVPSDPTKWPNFLYWAGSTLEEQAYVPEERAEEFERLLLRLCPTHYWIVVSHVTYGEPPS